MYLEAKFGIGWGEANNFLPRPLCYVRLKLLLYKNAFSFCKASVPWFGRVARHSLLDINHASCCLPFKDSIKIESWGNGNQTVNHLPTWGILLTLCWEFLKSCFSDHSHEENTIKSPLQFNNVRRILNEKAADLRMIQKFHWQCQQKLYIECAVNFLLTLHCEQRCLPNSDQNSELYTQNVEA